MRIFINPKDEKASVIYTHSFATAGALDKGLEKVFYVVLRVSPEERILVGEPDPEEVPPRIPYVGAKYTLDVFPTDQESTDGFAYLIVGKIIQQGDRFLIDEKYIPPCTATVSHFALLQAYKDFGSIQSVLQTDALKIIAKIQLKQQQRSSLQQSVEGLCREILVYIANTQFEYNNEIKQQPPISMIKHFSTLANKLLTFLSCLNPADKEEMLSYFYQWIDVTPGIFVETLTKGAGIIYQHQNISRSMTPISEFLNMLNNIYGDLFVCAYLHHYFLIQHNGDELILHMG